MPVRYPSLCQINTRVWLTELSETFRRPATLDDIPDNELDRLSKMGFDWIWLLSVWNTGLASQQVSRSLDDLRSEFKETLPDLEDQDIAGSGFAIAGYVVHPALGGDKALARLREKMRKRGLKLMLDFVPNHLALDHPWVEDHPEYFVAGTKENLSKEPQNYIRIQNKKGRHSREGGNPCSQTSVGNGSPIETFVPLHYDNNGWDSPVDNKSSKRDGDDDSLVLAHGRDPHFPGWSDTLQLDYSNPATQEAMGGELEKISRQCDGVRCDMAMLVIPEIFERTWGRPAPPFWPSAIQRVKASAPDFMFLAEVYWDMEWALQQQGFDYTYDKRLYDRLRAGPARPVREHLWAELDYQNKLARFLENHDEPRAAATFEVNQHQAAAVIAFLSPGLRFFHQGQMEGRKKRIATQLVRAPQEPVHQPLKKFYDELLVVLRQSVVRDGQWQLLECLPAAEGNGSWDSILAFAWQAPRREPLIVAVNYSPNPSQCRIRLPFPDLAGQSIRLQDLMSKVSYNRSGDEILSSGFFTDLPPWGYHVFEVIIPDSTTE